MGIVKRNRMILHLQNDPNKFVIYGAGTMARDIFEAMQQFNKLEPYCIVTCKDNINYMGYMKIYEISEVKEKIQKEGTIVLIAVGKKYEEQVARILKESNICYVMMSEFYRKDRLFDYANKSAEEYWDELAEWYADKHMKELREVPYITYNMQKEQKKDKCSKKIVMVVGRLSPRLFKISKALYNNGYKLVFLFYGSSVGEWKRDFAEIDLISERQQVCECVEEILFNIIFENPMVVHIFSQWGNPAEAYELIQAKKILTMPVVFEAYDIMNECYINIPEYWKKAERFCIENSDGVCCRGYEMRYLINKIDWHIKGKVIEFFDYCSDNEIQEDIIQSRKYDKRPLHLYYAGGITTEKEAPDFSYACWLDVIEICKKNKCHFHLYPSVWDEKRFSDYIELAEKSEFFHFHKTVSWDRLADEVSQYDYCIRPQRNDFLDGETNNSYTRTDILYTTTNQFYDALDAGLPIISASPVKLSKYFENKGVCLRWTIEEYDFEQMLSRREELKTKAIMLQNKLQISKHIYKLIDFYSSLYEHELN